MKILICHNYYSQRSGEGAVVDQEVDLLRSNGHEVHLFAYDNAKIGERIPLRHAGRVIYSSRTAKDVLRSIEGQEIDVAHVHNTWPLLSPSIYRTLWNSGIPVVKTVHNFRWLCPVATFYRDGAICRDCIKRPSGVLNAVRHRCYKKSLLGSSAAAIRLAVNRDMLKIYTRFVDVIVAQNEFVRGQLTANAFPAKKIVIRPNFTRIGGTAKITRGDHAIYMGRIDEAKGIRTLLAAAAMTSMPLRIFGHGPLGDWLQGHLADNRDFGGRVSYNGYVAKSILIEALATSRALIFPSEWYESYPLAIVEAFSMRKPVIASDLGSMPAIIEHGVNGMLFNPGDALDLAKAMEHLWSDDELQERFERGATDTYNEHMTPEAGHASLIQIYEKAIHRRLNSERED